MSLDIQLKVVVPAKGEISHTPPAVVRITLGYNWSSSLAYVTQFVLVFADKSFMPTQAILFFLSSNRQRHIWTKAHHSVITWIIHEALLILAISKTKKQFSLFFS